MKTIIKQRFSALASRDFRLLWLGLFISNVGSNMQLVGLNWHIYTLTGSAVAIGLVGLFRFLPISIFAFIGGPFADAHNRKRIMLVAYTVMAFFSTILALTSFFQVVNPVIMYAVTLVNAIAFSFDLPARQALTPNLVPRHHLINAMSLNTMMFQTSRVIGPAIGGFVIAGLGVSWIYAFNALSFLGVIMATLLIDNSGDIQGEATSVSFHSIKEGIVFLRSQTIIWSTMILDFVTTFFSSATALLPIYALDILHIGPQSLGFLYAAPAVGAALAGLITSQMKMLKNHGRLLLYSAFLYAGATVIFGLSSWYILSLVALFLVGFGDGISIVIRNTVRQLVTPDHLRGRVVSLGQIFFVGGPQLGEFEAGFVAGIFGPVFSVVSGGIAALASIGILAATIPTLRNFQLEQNKEH